MYLLCQVPIGHMMNSRLFSAWRGYGSRFEVLVLTTILIVAVLAPRTATAQYSLDIQWDISIGPAPGTQDNIGVCAAKGKVFVADGRGQWTVLDSEGHVLLRKQEPAIQGASRMVCSPTDELLVTLPRRKTLLAFSRDLVLLRSVQTPYSFRSFVADRSGSVYVVYPDKFNPVHKLDHGGKKIKDLGWAPEYADQMMAFSQVRQGKVLLDEPSGRIIFKPMNPYVFHVFDVEGNRISAVDRGGTQFALPQIQSGTGKPRLTPGDFTGNFFRLKSGEYVVHVVKTARLGSQHVQQRSYLDILGDSFQSLSEPIPTTGFGSPWAVDEDDNLYGLGGAPTLRLIKARLQRP